MEVDNLNAIGLHPIWSTVGSVTPIVIFYFLYLRPEWQATTKDRRLEILGIHGRPEKTDYFRLDPYEPGDRYKRADNAHVKVLQWIKHSQQPFLYLSGQSGTGKSSLLNAAVIPALTDEGAGFRVVKARPHDDLFGAIINNVKLDGVRWKQSARSVSEVRELLQRRRRNS